MRQMYTRLRRSSLVVMALLACMLFVAACGNNSGGAPTGNSGTPGTTATVPRTQNCGSVHSMQDAIIQADKTKASTIENCFWQAYQHCQSASMVYTQGGIDTLTVHTFSLKSQNKTCIISDYIQHALAPHPLQPGATYTCSSLTLQGDGLHVVSCGNLGSILVPAAR